MLRSTLYIKQILDWADAHKQRTGKWPEASSGKVQGTIDERWVNIDQCMRKGLRGLRPGNSLAKLLAERRGKRNRKQLPKYALQRILKWADAFHRRTGKWPITSSGPIKDAPGETWLAVDIALRKGQRGLPGGTSLAQLLDRCRAVQNRLAVPRLSNRKILKWADAFRKRTGNWPTAYSGNVSPGHSEKWVAIDTALKHGSRGLPGGSSLFKLLARHRGIGRHRRFPPLTI
jgi:hypothetical protein